MFGCRPTFTSTETRRSRRLIRLTWHPGLQHSPRGALLHRASPFNAPRRPRPSCRRRRPRIGRRRELRARYSSRMRRSIPSTAICCSCAARRISPGGTCWLATAARPGGRPRSRPHSRQRGWKPIRTSRPMVDGCTSSRPDRRAACTAAISTSGACNATPTATGARLSVCRNRSIPLRPNGFHAQAQTAGCTLAPAVLADTVKRISGARGPTARGDGGWRTSARRSTGPAINTRHCLHPMANGCSSRLMTATSNPRATAKAGRRGSASVRRSMRTAVKSARFFRPPATACCSPVTSRGMSRANFSFGDCKATKIGHRSALERRRYPRNNKRLGIVRRAQAAVALLRFSNVPRKARLWRPPAQG